MNPDIPIDGTPEAPAAPNETSGSAATAGALLRGLRQKHGLARESLATALHVPITKLAALEEDRPEDLPDAVFARALALAICRHLHEDPKPILAALPQLDANPLRDHNARGLDTPLQRPHLRPSQRAPSHETAHRGTRVVGVALLGGVLLLAGLVLLWQGSQSPELQRATPARPSSTSGTAASAGGATAPGVAPAQEAASNPVVLPVEASPREPNAAVGTTMVVQPVHSAGLVAAQARPQPPAIGASHAQ